MVNSLAAYLLPADLTWMPLGVSWGTVGQQGTTNPAQPANAFALDQVCRMATSHVRTEVQQELRSSFVTERLQGPGHRIGFHGSQARFVTSFMPVAKVVAGAVAFSANFPKSWTAIPPGAAYPEDNPMGSSGTSAPETFGGGMNAILISPQFVNWCAGRMGLEVQMSFLHGWPHTQLVADATAGDTTVQVDDLTGWLGAEGWLLDSASSEVVTAVGVDMATPPAYSDSVTYFPGQCVVYQSTTYQCLISSGPGAPNGSQTPPSSSGPYWSTTVEPVGPGAVTLAQPLSFDHVAPVTLTALPYGIRYATALFAKAIALQRGLATLSVPATAGVSPTAEAAIESAERTAVATLNPYRRIY